MNLTPLQQDVMSIVESKEGMLIASIKYFYARQRYPTISFTEALKGTDGINEAIRDLKKAGYLRMHHYRWVYTTEKWHDEQKGGEHV
jgi:hypothetical protein